MLYFVWKGGIMYKISDFAKKTGISKDTLRYYDHIGFFKPSYVDFFSGYRYYLEDQVLQMDTIQKLKDIGCSLETISRFLETHDIHILLEKKKEMEKNMEKLNQILNRKDVYSVQEADYKKYVEINGTKQATCPQALEVRDHNAFYFLVYKNDIFLLDFCIFQENNWITIDKQILLDKVIMKKVFQKISAVVDFITFYIPSTMEEYIKKLHELYPIIDMVEAFQEKERYQKVSIQLKDIPF